MLLEIHTLDTAFFVSRLFGAPRHKTKIAIRKPCVFFSQGSFIFRKEFFKDSQHPVRNILYVHTDRNGRILQISCNGYEALGMAYAYFIRKTFKIRLARLLMQYLHMTVENPIYQTLRVKPFVVALPAL